MCKMYKNVERQLCVKMLKCIKVKKDNKKKVQSMQKLSKNLRTARTRVRLSPLMKSISVTNHETVKLVFSTLR